MPIYAPTLPGERGGRSSEDGELNRLESQEARRLGLPRPEIHRLSIAGDTFPYSNVLFVDEANERVGIGTSSPLDKLHVEGSGDTEIRVTTTSAASGYCGIRFNESSTQRGYLRYDTSNNYFTWYTANQDLYLNVGSGNVGIGASSPSAKLHVDRTSTTGESVLLLEGSRSNISSLSIGTAYGSFRLLGDNGLYGLYGGTDGTYGDTWLQVMRGDGTATAYDLLLQPKGGYVGIGTTNPGVKLDVQTNAAGSFAASFFNDGNALDRLGIKIQAGVDATTGNGQCRWVYLYDGNGSPYAYIGNVHAGTTAAFYTLSDARRKEKIRDTSVNGLETINSVKLRSFDWKPFEIENPRTGITKTIQRPHQNLGLVAQELLTSYPEAVGYDDVNDEYTVAESTLVLPLIKAVQELSAQVEQQQVTIERLEQRLSALESKPSKKAAK